ncbi:hypothetical protein FACS1894184_04680 [Clostridia bacterium]|nr:hypothetical protein FACS1894184_04680 [Clostridia bacterium]
MSRAKGYDKTHRCEGSLTARRSVRHSNSFPNEGLWEAGDSNYSWGGEMNMGGIWEIHYCPWCGAKLDESTEYTSMIHSFD